MKVTEFQVNGTNRRLEVEAERSLLSVLRDDLDLTGAKYDCATKLPDDLDPVTASMINVEGECRAP